MRTILFSLITLFTISTTGCLDDAQQPEPDQKVLAAEHSDGMQQAAADQAAADQALRNNLPDQQPVVMQNEIDGSTSEVAPGDESDRLFCNTVADCEEGYWCRINDNRCIPAKH